MDFGPAGFLGDMTYPTHKQPSIVSQYEHIIARALDVYPKAVFVSPLDGKSPATTVARLRDSVAALREYVYPETTLTAEQLGQLAQAPLQVGNINGQIVIAAPESVKALRHTNRKRSAQLVGVDTTGLPDELNQPTAELIHALGVLVKHGAAESFSFAGVSLEATLNSLPEGVDAYELSDKIFIS